MESVVEVQKYYDLGASYLHAADGAFSDQLYEPALFNALHAIELFAKAAIVKKLNSEIKTHNVGGLFSQHYLTEVGMEICKQLNTIFTKYNMPRYPSESDVEGQDVLEALDFASTFENLIKI